LKNYKHLINIRTNYRHQNEFLEGGDYGKIRNVTLSATNRSGKRIFPPLNRLLLSHSKIRAPSIDDILKIRMSTGWSMHSNILDPQQADPTKLGVEAIKAFLLQGGASVPLKKLTICFLLDQMQTLKSKPEIASLGLKISIRKTFTSPQHHTWLAE